MQSGTGKTAIVSQMGTGGDACQTVKLHVDIYMACKHYALSRHAVAADARPAGKYGQAAGISWYGLLLSTGRPAMSVIHAHRAPDPAPVDEPMPVPEPQEAPGHHPGPVHPVPQDDPVPHPHPS
ncbi:hypothetical protein CSQ92_27465 [Janthinobacterium sp. BJB446]|nr:hypothetical protein CSQ92_27465 [Janthinobacterium sp. BJB446]